MRAGRRYRRCRLRASGVHVRGLAWGSVPGCSVTECRERLDARKGRIASATSYCEFRPRRNSGIASDARLGELRRDAIAMRTTYFVLMMAVPCLAIADGGVGTKTEL